MPGFINLLRWDMGKVSPLYFNKDCHSGDWKKLHIDFATDFLNTNRIRILITPNVSEVGKNTHIAAAVPIVRNVTSKGFDLAARSSDCAEGQTGFHWIAFSDDLPTERQNIKIRTGLLPSKCFEPDCVKGDWATWKRYRYPRSFASWCPETEEGDEPHVIVTTGNINVPRVAAVVGIVDGRELTFPSGDREGFTLHGRNSDCVCGSAMFYYLSVSRKCVDLSPLDLFIDDGDIWVDHLFSPDCSDGDWFAQDIYFSDVFMTPPKVLLTANDRGFDRDHFHTAAVVGMATNVTTHGFTLMTRNSDCASGRVGFYYAAIGCLEKTGCSNRG